VPHTKNYSAKKKLKVIKKILTPIIISLILIVGLATIHNVLYHFFPIKHKSIGFGLTVINTGILFTTLIVIFNFYLEFNGKYKYPIGLLLCLICVIFPIQAFEYRPNRSLLLIIMTFFGFGLSIIKQKRQVKADFKLAFTLFSI